MNNAANNDPVTRSRSAAEAAAEGMLIALQACENALSPVMANHDCGDKPDGKDRCGECLGCMNWATWLMASSAIAKATGQVQS